MGYLQCLVQGENKMIEVTMSEETLGNMLFLTLIAGILIGTSLMMWGRWIVQLIVRKFKKDDSLRKSTAGEAGDTILCNIHGTNFTISEDDGLCPSCVDEWIPVDDDEEDGGEDGN